MSRNNYAIIKANTTDKVLRKEVETQCRIIEELTLRPMTKDAILALCKCDNSVRLQIEAQKYKFA